MIQHPELDGPYSIPITWKSQIDLSTGINYQIPNTSSDNHWNTTQRLFVANAPKLATYRTSPASFSRVWAGDVPTSPAHTVHLQFPDTATAQSVLLSCGAIDIIPGN